MFFGLVAMAGHDPHPPAPAGSEGPPSLSTTGYFAPPSILHVHDVSLEFTSATTAVLAWEADRKHVPVFRFGRDVAVKELAVTAGHGRYSVELPPLEPSATYTFRISGWAGGGAHVGRFTAPPPGGPAPSRQRLHLLDLPGGGTLVAPTFGASHFARPLWTRDSVDAELALAGGLAFLHDGRHLYAIDATDGSVRWTHPVVHTSPVPRPITVAGAVIVTSPEGPLALDQETGRPRWRLPLPGVNALYVRGDEVYAHMPGPPARLHRVQAQDGRLISILPMPDVPHRIELAENHVLVIIDEPGDARGEMLVRAVDRLRGETRWEKLFYGDELPVLAPVTSGDRLIVAHKDRVSLLAMSTGASEQSWPLPAPALVIAPTPDGGVLVCTGGPVPRAHLLDAQAKLGRSWTLPTAPLSAAIAGQRAVLSDGDGVQILELTAGPRWGISGWVPARRVALDTEGHLLAQLPADPEASLPERVFALGLR